MPDGLREASLALGVPAVADLAASWSADRLPRPGHRRRSSAIARAFGETAPLILTAFGATAT